MSNARKRRKPGPAPGTGGRPVDAARGPVVGQIVLRTYEADEQRLTRLRALWGGTDASIVRRALEMADDLMREV